MVVIAPILAWRKNKFWPIALTYPFMLISIYLIFYFGLTIVRFWKEKLAIFHSTLFGRGCENKPVSAMYLATLVAAWGALWAVVAAVAAMAVRSYVK